MDILGRECGGRIQRAEAEYRETERWWQDNVEPRLRRAFPNEYEAWLDGHVQRGGHVSHSYDYRMPDSFYVVASSLVEIDRPLYGSLAVNVICPEGREIRFPNGYGHCSVYTMEDYQVRGHRWTPTYLDVAVKKL